MKTSSCKRFTLIELLVVIAIIVILAGLLFPALGTVRNNARKSKAHSECLSLKAAILMYETEFSQWPVKVSGTADRTLSESEYIDMCKFLTCADKNRKNAKNMVFYEAGVGYNPDNGILDPWGNPYRVYLDVNFDGRIDNSATNNVDNENVIKLANKYNGRSENLDLSTRVAVYSIGVSRDPEEGGVNNVNINDLASRKKLVISW